MVTALGEAMEQMAAGLRAAGAVMAGHAAVIAHNTGACPATVATGMSGCEVCGWVSPDVAVPVPAGGGRSYGRGMGAGDPCGGGELRPPA
jgi:hypothetical protein